MEKKPQRIPNQHGWVLIVRDESDHTTGERKGPWYIGWHNVFTSRGEAVTFAKESGWTYPHRAIRAKIVALQKV